MSKSRCACLKWFSGNCQSIRWTWPALGKPLLWEQVFMCTLVFSIGNNLLVTILYQYGRIFDQKQNSLMLFTVWELTILPCFRFCFQNTWFFKGVFMIVNWWIRYLGNYLKSSSLMICVMFLFQFPSAYEYQFW